MCLAATEADGSLGRSCAFNHNWDPYWSSSLFGSASWVHYNGSANDAHHGEGAYCAQYISSNKLMWRVTPPRTSVATPTSRYSRLVAFTRWTPVKNLTVFGRSDDTRLDQKFTGTAALAPSGSQAGHVLRVQGPGHGDDERSRSAQLLILI